VKISERTEGEVLVVQPHGPLIGSDAEEFGRHISKVLDERGPRVVLDASKIAFVDSQGLEVLVDATNLLIRNGQLLKVACLNQTLGEVLELNEVSAMFEQYAEVEEALSPQ
jgi:anti-sigma B factor antagonist